MKQPLRNDSANFKVTVVLAALKDERTLAQLAQRFDMYANQVSQWKDELLQRAAEIFNTDQGSHFTSAEFAQVLKDHDIRISMDGKGCWRDNVFVERLWKTIKYEEIYLHAYNTVSDARAGIAKHFTFYNQCRPRTEHGGETPDAMYFGNLEMKKAA